MIPHPPHSPSPSDAEDQQLITQASQKAIEAYGTARIFAKRALWNRPNLDRAGTLCHVLPGSWFFPRSAERSAATWRRGGWHRYVPSAVSSMVSAATPGSGLPSLVPAGTDFRPMVGGFRYFPKVVAGDQATIISAQRNSVRSLHTRCMTTASLRATATFARRMPIRLASANPHVFSADRRRWRASNTGAASNRY
jgi:hypothetical protein